MVGRALASRRTRVVALVYPAMEHKLGASGMEFVTSAARTASAAGYHLVLWPVSNDADELTELVGQGLVDGVLLMEVQLEDARVEVLRATRTPFALIGRSADLTGLVYVDIDFDRTMEQAVDHLIGLGHRHLVLVAGSQASASFRTLRPLRPGGGGLPPDGRRARVRGRGPGVRAEHGGGPGRRPTRS